MRQQLPVLAERSLILRLLRVICEWKSVLTATLFILVNNEKPVGAEELRDLRKNMDWSRDNWQSIGALLFSLPEKKKLGGAKWVKKINMEARL